MKLLHAAHDNLIDRTRRVWEPRIGRDLTNDDARQIANNLTGFFSIEMPTPANDAGKPGPSDNKEVRHDR